MNRAQSDTSSNIVWYKLNTIDMTPIMNMK